MHVALMQALLLRANLLLYIFFTSAVHGQPPCMLLFSADSNPGPGPKSGRLTGIRSDVDDLIDGWQFWSVSGNMFRRVAVL